ncbi:MAG: pyridoxal phosphate-dependent aminotransferase [Christensenellaceae bacterium]|nr:pyridoxal phosphate-dependent aminotransferase [Christensenellaceae bacterium]
MKISKKVAAVQGSVTLAIDAKAKAMRAAGEDVIGFGAGEPDFDTPSHIRAAAVAAMEAGKTRYTPAAGELALQQAICAKLLRDNGLQYEPNQIVVSNGAKHSLFNIFQALLDEGDEVIVPSPCWVSYPELIRMAGGVPVFVKGEKSNKYKVGAAEIERAVSPKTKAILINSPNNPNGFVYSKEELSGIAALLPKRDLYAISDEIYEYLVYGGAEHLSIASLSGEAKARTIVVNGVSKAYAMTGWRIGYTASPVELAKAMTNFQSHSTSNPNSIAQHAAIAALNGPTDELKSMVAEFARRRDRIVALIRGIEGLGCVEPEGAFYVMVDISALFGKKLGQKAIEGSMSFTELLLSEEKVAVVPGDGFLEDDCVRLSYAVSMGSIEEGLKRIDRFVKKLH